MSSCPAALTSIAFPLLKLLLLERILLVDDAMFLFPIVFCLVEFFSFV
jgi:hypothetical protein